MTLAVVGAGDLIDHIWPGFRSRFASSVGISSHRSDWSGSSHSRDRSRAARLGATGDRFEQHLSEIYPDVDWAATKNRPLRPSGRIGVSIGALADERQHGLAQCLGASNRFVGSHVICRAGDKRELRRRVD
jgi:hypothetical protein